MWHKDRNNTERNVVDEIVNEFRHQSAPLMKAGDLEGLRFLYSNCVATARLENPKVEKEIIRQVREALRSTLLEPSRRVRRGWFDSL